MNKNLKGKFSAGSDVIPEVKQCINHSKKLLTHIYNTSYKFSIFPDRLEIDEVKALYKKRGIFKTYSIRDQYQFYHFSQNYLYKSLISFATKNHYISTGPNGFREQKSTETTQSFMECIQQALDTCLHATIIFSLFHKSIRCHKS